MCTKWWDFLGGSNGAKNQCPSIEIVILIIELAVWIVALVPGKVLVWGWVV